MSNDVTLYSMDRSKVTLKPLEHYRLPEKIIKAIYEGMAASPLFKRVWRRGDTIQANFRPKTTTHKVRQLIESVITTLGINLETYRRPTPVTNNVPRMVARNSRR